MGIWDAFSEIVEAVTPWSVVEAEAPAAEPKVRSIVSTDRAIKSSSAAAITAPNPPHRPRAIN